MQSTGHTSTQAVSFVPMQGSAMMYIPIGSSSSVQRDGGDSSTTVASAPRGACALVGAPARGSLGCELDREPGPVLAPAPRGARRPPLVTAGASRAADGGWAPVEVLVVPSRRDQVSPTGSAKRLASREPERNA